MLLDLVRKLMWFRIMGGKWAGLGGFGVGIIGLGI